MRVLIATLLVASMSLGMQAAAEPPEKKADEPAASTTPSAADPEMGVEELLAAARKQGFTLVDKKGTQRLCRSKTEIGSRLNRKMECFTPQEWQQMQKDTRESFRENMRKQSNPDST